MINKRIQHRKQTQKRRKSFQCKTYTVKVDNSKLSNISKEHLNKLFLETKWFYNFLVSQQNLKNVNSKINNIPVYVFQEDTQEYIIENRDLNCISSQMKQGVLQRIWDNLVSLSRIKEEAIKKGEKPKTGRLQFKSKVRSIPLKQHNNTYTINFDNNTIKIQGLKQRLKVNGLEQIPKDSEIANAQLVKFQKDYYFKITIYQEKPKENIPEEAVSIDFGCQDQLILSNGIKIKYEFPVSKKIKKLDRKIQKGKRKDSKNKYKDKLKREKEYQKLDNQKKNTKNKIVNILTKHYKYVIVQDENIKAWQAGNHGKKINSTGIGGIMRDLKSKSHTLIMVDRFFPSSQLCSKCGHRHKLELSERTYICKKCGNIIDRDVNAAINIGNEGLKNYYKENKIPTECRKLKLEETATSTATILNLLSQIQGVVASSGR